MTKGEFLKYVENLLNERIPLDHSVSITREKIMNDVFPGTLHIELVIEHKAPNTKDD